MADVVRLKEFLSRTPRREAVRHETPAEILLFTGVRYERLTPAMMAGGKRKGGARSNIVNGQDSARRS